MTIVFNRYTDSTRRLQEAMQHMNVDASVAVLKDDGFLPDGVLSSYGYFIYGQDSEELKEKGLFYNSLEVPEYWEIRSADIKHGEVYDMGCKKANIYFTEPLEKKNVHRVEWFTESGWIYKIDYYNKYALKYASEFLDKDGNVESKAFYSGQNQEVIVEQPRNNTITLLEGGKTKAFFVSYTEFLEYYIEEARLKEKCILFIQDSEEFGLLDLRSGVKSIWKYVLFANNELLNKYISMGGKNGYCFYAIQEEYPANDARGEVLILTASDRLEGIDYLIHELPEAIFHIAANTQVSDKLRKLGDQPNVRIYPQINVRDLNILWNKCNFYLDINYYREIFNAIENAHQKNLLILGFENTLHHRGLTAEECIFSKADAGKMVRAMKKMINHVGSVQEKLVKQQRKRNEIWEKMKGTV